NDEETQKLYIEKLDSLCSVLEAFSEWKIETFLEKGGEQYPLLINGVKRIPKGLRLVLRSEGLKLDLYPIMRNH
ncbi:MAG: hypothetical protein CVV01_02925, partial [Firmicutes bacterium HGW-Firmicutes-6]